MSSGEQTNSLAVQMVQKALGGPLKPGELGVLLARAGVGKSACLTQIALEHLLQDRPVLHVCIDEVPDKIKVWYLELLRNLTQDRPQELGTLQKRIEPLRFILSYLHQTFNPDKLRQSVQDLRDQAGFHPAMVILDGLALDQVPRSTIESLLEFSREQSVSMWLSGLTHRHIDTTNERGIPYPCHEVDDLFQAILVLDPVPGALQLKVLKHYDRLQPEGPTVRLNPQTFMLI